ncbi:MAG: PPC domain-containing protein [Fuerstiella sp.]|nr:PPC domain-containing protein [Fuerstiella sp.]
MPHDRVRLLRFISAVLLTFAGTSCLYAIEPTASYIFPAGAQRGTIVQVRVGGLYLHDGCQFQMGGPGVVASDRIVATDTVRFARQFAEQKYFPQENSYPRDYDGSIKVDADSPLGIRYWDLWTSQGGTPPQRFMIGDLPEVMESEIDGDAIPQIVQLPVTANGRIYPREDIDIWSFKARAGQELTCEVHAARLGSTLDSFLEVRDGRGHRIAENSERFSSDSFLRFTAPADDTYSVHIRDVRMGGLQSSVYRLTMTDGPYIDTTFPMGGQRGETVSLELSGQAVSRKPVEVALPADGPADYTHELDVAGVRQVIRLDLSKFPNVLETEPNGDPSNATELQAPVVLNGRISEAEDEDCWRLKARKGETVQFEFRAHRSGAPLNPFLIVSDSTGENLHQTEDRSEFRFPEDGTYFLTIKERFRPRGGPKFVYRLQIGPSLTPIPDFRLTSGSQALTLVRGASVEFDVHAERLGGFGGEIKLLVEDLPPEVTVADAVIPDGKKSIKIKLSSGDKTLVAATRIRIRGTAEIEGQLVTRTASFRLSRAEPQMDTVMLVTALAAPFKFSGQYKLPFALRGTTHYRRYQLDRGGFTGQIIAKPADVQPRYQWGSSGPAIRIPSDVAEFDYPLQVSTWSKVGLTGRSVIMIVGEVEDIDGMKHTVAWSSSLQPDQIMIQPNAGPLAITTLNSSVIASSDQPAEVQVRIRRDTELPLPVTLTLLTSAHMQGVDAVPVEIPMNEDRGTLRIRFASNAGPFNMPLVIRATARPPEAMLVRGRPLRQGDPIIADARIEVVVPQLVKPL